MSKKILIVDDDLFIRDAYQAILESEGFEVEIARDGAEGYDKMKNASYDLVLLDVMMPKLDGIGVLVKLGENQISKQKIVFITNLAHDPALKDALKKGALAYLTKADLSPEQLVAKVKEYLGEKVQEEKKIAATAEAV